MNITLSAAKLLLRASFFMGFVRFVRPLLLSNVAYYFINIRLCHISFGGCLIFYNLLILFYFFFQSSTRPQRLYTILQQVKQRNCPWLWVTTRTVAPMLPPLPFKTIRLIASFAVSINMLFDYDSEDDQYSILTTYMRTQKNKVSRFTIC